MKLREFSETHIDEDCRGLEGRHENCLFFNCRFDNLAGLSLINCDLNRSTFETSSIAKALKFSLTLDCHSFNNVGYSPLLFDLLLYLMTTTKGNDEKRKKLEELLGPERMEAFRRVLRELEG